LRFVQAGKDKKDRSFENLLKLKDRLYFRTRHQLEQSELAETTGGEKLSRVMLQLV